MFASAVGHNVRESSVILCVEFFYSPDGMKIAVARISMTTFESEEL